MNILKDLIDDFSKHAINHHKFGLEGDFKKGNIEIKKINKIFNEIKLQNGLDELLKLIDSDILEVATLSAVYCMRFNPEKCLPVLVRLSNENIPKISFEAKYAVQNWLNNKWYID